ncbi:25S rRNA (adenine645-N1)-methyltransferase [Bulinus truncatus]|nr:25S rRNA (adenine645-N1)-methyltransferase [Bulinus truncatus]
MSKFELNNDWDVDVVAETLNSSLFGNLKVKSKKQKPKFTSSTKESFIVNMEIDDGDEKLSKKDKKRLKNRKRKTNKEKYGSNHDDHPQNKMSLKNANRDAKIIIEKDAVIKNAGETKKKSKIKDKKKKKDKTDSSIERNNDVSLSTNSNSEVKQSRKRKHSANLHSSFTKQKKIKLEQTVSSENNTEGTDKNRRNRKKKNTSRKNREKQMALKNKPKPSLAVINKDDINGSINGNSKTIGSSDDKHRKNNNPLFQLSTGSSSKKKKLSKEFKSIETSQIKQLPLVHKSSLQNENTHEKLESSKKNKQKKKQSDKDFKNLNGKVTKNDFQKEHKLKKKNDKNVISSQAYTQADSEIKALSDLKRKDKKGKKKKNVEKNNIPVLKTLDVGQSHKAKKSEKKNIGNLMEIKPVDSSKKQTEQNGLKAVQSTEASTNVQSLWSSTSFASEARKKLKSARFRYINEQLYTSTGSEALAMFRTDQDAFKVYHEGYENQVSKWPVNPLDIIIKQIKDKPKNLVIADFGCGDAKLAASLPQTVHSFDLVAVNDRVTACNMSKVPLPNESVDIAVFCLSLMGTNIGDYILEANRVLKTGGLLKVIEVVSRFKGLSEFIGGICKRGFLLLNKRDVNEMFYQLDFKKVSTAKKSSALGVMTLKPCLYKKR